MCGHKPVLSMKKKHDAMELNLGEFVETNGLPYFTVRGFLMGIMRPIENSAGFDVQAVYNERDPETNVYKRKLSSIGVVGDAEAAKKLITDHFARSGNCARYKAPKVAA